MKLRETTSVTGRCVSRSDLSHIDKVFEVNIFYSTKFATHARTAQKVPAEAVAYLLHHRVTLQGSTHALSIPEATAYYSRLPLERLLALLFEAQSQISSHIISSYLQVPLPKPMEQMEETLRLIFEQWSMIGPTVFGYCSAGLCASQQSCPLFELPSPSPCQSAHPPFFLLIPGARARRILGISFLLSVFNALLSGSITI